MSNKSCAGTGTMSELDTKDFDTIEAEVKKITAKYHQHTNGELTNAMTCYMVAKDCFKIRVSQLLDSAATFDGFDEEGEFISECEDLQITTLRLGQARRKVIAIRKKYNISS